MYDHNTYRKIVQDSIEAVLIDEDDQIHEEEIEDVDFFENDDLEEQEDEFEEWE